MHYIVVFKETCLLSVSVVFEMVDNTEDCHPGPCVCKYDTNIGALL